MCRSVCACACMRVCVCVITDVLIFRGVTMSLMTSDYFLYLFSKIPEVTGWKANIEIMTKDRKVNLD